MLASGGEKDTQAASGSREQPMETDQDDLKELPFQLVVKYTDTEGATALRVVTQSRPITYDRREAEKSKIWMHSLQKKNLDSCQTLFLLYPRIHSSCFSCITGTDKCTNPNAKYNFKNSQF